MARYKAIDTSPRFLAVDLEKQLLPGSFEHAVHHLLEHEFDLSLFDTRYRNDQSGACAYPPGMLLKVNRGLTPISVVDWKVRHLAYLGFSVFFSAAASSVELGLRRTFWGGVGCSTSVISKVTRSPSFS